MDDPGLVEFYYPDGSILIEDLAMHSHRRLHKDDHLQRDGVDWLVFDRVDRAGRPVCLCRPTVPGIANAP